jgi:hypothetical protein
MRRDRLQTAAAAIRRQDHRNALAGAVAGVGAAVAGLAMLRLTGPNAWAVAAAVGLAVLATAFAWSVTLQSEPAEAAALAVADP